MESELINSDNKIFGFGGRELNKKLLKPLLKKGNECIVYMYGNHAVKLFRTDFSMPHLKIDEVRMLKDIKTKRILLPFDAVLDEKK